MFTELGRLTSVAAFAEVPIGAKLDGMRQLLLYTDPYKQAEPGFFAAIPAADSAYIAFRATLKYRLQ